MSQQRIESLEHQVKQLQVDKIELIRSTSTEIERLRQIIRTLTDPHASNLDLAKLEYTPLSNEERNKLNHSNNPNQSSYSSLSTQIHPNQHRSPSNAQPPTNINTTQHKKKPSLTEYIPSATQNGMGATDQYLSTNATLNEPIQVEKWQSPNRSLGSLREEKSYEYDNKSSKLQQSTGYNNKPQTNSNLDSDEEFLGTDEQKSHRKNDTTFKLNTKRMSYKGFEFGDFGFMTTDFDQLSRGHTQWVNQVMHHPVQNGIVITASDDWCVMFWRFKKAVGNDELKQEKLNSILNKQKLKNNVKPTASNNYYIDPKLQHIIGEIDLLPVLKINTGLEVKAICMSSDGAILACTCYDEEEDEGNPELQLYFDADQNWTFKHHQFHPYYGNIRNKEREKNNNKFKNEYDRPDSEMKHNNNDDSGRLIKRRIISLPFEPIPHCICFTRDNKYVFVAMYSSIQILRELNEELQEEYGDQPVPEDMKKWPDHPVSLCCVNVNTEKIMECQKIWKYLKEDEHVSCMAISPNGARIAIGTSLGQLIVTGVLNLTGDFDDEEDFNPILQKIWSSEMMGDAGMGPSIMKNNRGLIVEHNGMNDDDEDTDGSVTAIDWSPDSDWIVAGYASGTIKFWKKNEERRMSTQLNRTIKTWMGAANVNRKNKMFDCKWYLEGLHIEAINSLSIRGSIMCSGADDGNVVIHDLLETFVDSKDNIDNSPITIGRVDKIHGGRMVNSVCLTRNYSEDNLLVPSTGFFMVTSGADNIVHCVSLLDVCRESIRNKYLTEKQQQLLNQKK